MKNKGVIILGSSRSQGNTNKIVTLLQKHTGFDCIDLKTKNIGSFDYEFQNKEDDFLPLLRSIVQNYDTIIFATPVYWYAMSGILKNFFDRITDCMTTEKELGRQLRGKNTGMISCGSSPELKTGFTMPFVESAHYLGMHYLGDIHTWLENDGIPDKVSDMVLRFSEKFKNQT